MDLAELLQAPPGGALSYDALVPAPGVVQVGWVELTEDLSPALTARLTGGLVEAERARLRSFRFPEDRDAFLLGRTLIRGLLARLLGVQPSEVPLSFGPHGRPELAPGVLEDVPSFNVSHTRGVLGFALSRATVGLDVERFRRDPDPLSIGRQVFSPQEIALLEALPPDAQRVQFRRLWALKEAYLKARGTGLTLPAREVTCALDAQVPGGVRLSFTDVVQDEPSRWQCVELRPTEHTWAAVCVEVARGQAARVDEAWLRLPEA